ncbi:phenylacetaldehyde reductase-like isoform X2 [Amaranthus tricolor]|uniref:phenylacetaldehyde reductase-like isoform X2 n=1 Tax=Amaranthus tricolor TaxID=29722 RepID=UPI0025895B39|nr:phenylacetaldehyde reductase-like isoform X2 [Amaranthus tricolor]
MNIWAELLEPAVKGTLSVLNSCAKYPSIKRVVLTSSLAAVVCNGKPLSPDVVVDETWFSDPDFCKNFKVMGEHGYSIEHILMVDIIYLIQ